MDVLSDMDSVFLKKITITHHKYFFWRSEKIRLLFKRREQGSFYHFSGMKNIFSAPRAKQFQHLEISQATLDLSLALTPSLFPIQARGLSAAASQEAAVALQQWHG